MRNFIIGSPSFRPQLSCPTDPRREECVAKSSPPAKVTGLPDLPNALKTSGLVPPLRSPLCDSRLGQALHSRRTSAPPSADLAKQNTFIDNPAPRDSDRQKLDKTFDSTSQIPLAPTATLPCQDYPRIDLVALVREKRKAKKFQKKRLPAPTLQERQRCRVVSRNSNHDQSRYRFSTPVPARLTSVNHWPATSIPALAVLDTKLTDSLILTFTGLRL